MIDHSKSNDLLQRDWLEYIHTRLGAEPWVPVYSYDNVDILNFAFLYSALVPNQKVKDVLQYIRWDLNVGSGLPGTVVSFGNDGRKTEQYYRYGSDEGIEPLVICREFHGVKPKYLEISEEFRLFHNLFHDTKSNKYVRITESGDEEDVIVVEEEPKRVLIKLKPLKQFLAVKKMHLAVFFSIDRSAAKALADLGLKKSTKEVREENYACDLFVGPIESFGGHHQWKTLSRLFGKKLIPGGIKKTSYSSGIWPFDEDDRKYEDFIIGFDQDGDPVSHACDPDLLSNYFGANPAAPNYVTPVFFKREVLTKYYSRPEKYEVADGHLRCRGLWGLRMDNNHDKYLVVFLGDLGRDLPHNEQIYWKSFNVPPDDKISEVNFRRSMLGEFTDPQKADLVFKYRFEQFQTRWQKRFGWPLFKPLLEDDEHNYKVLRVPMTNEQHEFDQQSLALTKVLIDSLNEEEIKGQIKGTIPKEAKGINKLAIWLQEQGCTDSDPHIKFLRSLQDLRNGAGHRKGEAYQRGATYFKLDERPLADVFEDILKQAATLLKYLEERLMD